jgi:tRNA A-37 threonylcarbamoyl transferase component Bud32
VVATVRGGGEGDGVSGGEIRDGTTGEVVPGPLVTADRPLFLAAKSAGTVIALQPTLLRSLPLAGLVLLAPVAKVSKSYSSLRRTIGKALSTVAPTLAVASINVAKLCSDPTVQQEYEADPLVIHGNIQAKTGATVLAAMDGWQLDELRLPTLIVAGSADAVVDSDSAVFLYSAMTNCRDKLLKIYEGFWHDVVHEPEGYKVLRDIRRWLRYESAAFRLAQRAREGEGDASDAFGDGNLVRTERIDGCTVYATVPDHLFHNSLGIIASEFYEEEGGAAGAGRSPSGDALAMLASTSSSLTTVWRDSATSPLPYACSSCAERFHELAELHFHVKANHKAKRVQRDDGGSIADWAGNVVSKKEKEKGGGGGVGGSFRAGDDAAAPATAQSLFGRSQKYAKEGWLDKVSSSKLPGKTSTNSRYFRLQQDGTLTYDTSDKRKLAQSPAHLSPLAQSVTSSSAAPVVWTITEATTASVDPTKPSNIRLSLSGDPADARVLIAPSADEASRWVAAFLTVAQARESPSVGIDDFQLLKVIGSGGYSKVYQVIHKATRKVYALKVMSKGRIAQKGEERNILAEKRILQRLAHPFLVKLYYAFQTPDKVYFALDFVNGGELFFHLQQVGSFPEDRTRFYVAEIGTALEYLHSEGVVYRDLKPENILLHASGHVRLTDFGVSKVLDGAAGEAYTETLVGTDEYLAPEVLLAQPFSFPIDWWALGVVTYEMLTGLPPFYDQDKKRMFEKVIHEPLTPPPGVSPACAAAVQLLLAKDPADRVKNLDDLAATPWFTGLDMALLARQGVTPPYLPPVDSEHSVRLIDTDFLREKAEITHTGPAIPYEGFTFKR